MSKKKDKIDEKDEPLCPQTDPSEGETKNDDAEKAADRCETGEKKKLGNFKERLKAALALFWSFFKIGIVCFGGGYAMIALIEREIVEKKNWLTSKEMLEIIAIAESTPGAISINMATYVGTKRAGIIGAVFATLGVVLPSFLIIFAISFFIIGFKEIKWVEYAFKGIRAAVLVLILNAVIKLFKQLERTLFVILVALGALLLCLFTPLDVVIVLLIFALVGLIYNIIKRAVEAKKK